MFTTYYKTLWICILMLCAVNSLTAQSFNSLKKNPVAAYDATLNTLLNNNDVSGMANYLKSNPQSINNASSSKSEQGYGSKAIVHTTPLLYDAVNRILQGSCSLDMGKVIIDAGCDVNAVFEEKTPVYLILDYIATHPIERCETAEQLLFLIASGKNFDVNYRYKSLLPPLAYLIRENHHFLGKFDKKYISDSVLKFLIDKGSPINTYDNEGNSLMNFAIETDNQYLSSYFIQNGINLGKKNKEGNDAMYLAIAAGNLPAIKQILAEGYDLNIHTLKNAASSFSKYPDTYDFLTARFAGQVTTYDDIKLFTGNFSDKFSLVQPKLYAIYVSDYKPVELNRNTFINLVQNNQDIESIARIIFQNKDFQSTAQSFINRHSAYDPDDKIKNARDLVDIFTLCEGLGQVIPSTYINYHVGWFMAAISESTGGTDIGIDERTAKYHNSILTQSHEIATKLESNNSFNTDNQIGTKIESFFENSDELIVAKHGKYVETWNRDAKIFNEHLARSRAKEAEYKAKMCAQCEIDFKNSNNKLPDSQHSDDIVVELLFSYDKPGVFYMKNGDKYEFYQNSDFTWKVSTSWFSSKEFKTFEQMLKYFVEACEKKYCK